MAIYDDEKMFWIVREYYWDSTVEMRQKTDAEYSDDLIAFIGPQRRSVKVIVDPSAASFKAEVAKRGIWCVGADNDVSDGIPRAAMVLNKGLARFCREDAPNDSRDADLTVL